MGMNIANSSAPAASLTFGVEFEFLYLWHASVPGHESLELVHKALEDAGVLIHPFKLQLPTYEKWSVTDDPTVKLTGHEYANRPKDCKVDGVEVISRVLQYEDESWVGEVDQVLGVLHKLNKPSGRHRVLPNLTCGFHVHVGQGPAGFSLEEMKRVLMLVTAFEHQLDQLHGVSRIDETAYIKGAAAHLTEHLGTAGTLPDWLRELGNFIPQEFPDKKYAYNFYNCGYIESRHRTIEFRQHRGTLDRKEIHAWIDVVTSVVRFCTERSQYDIVSFCLEHAPDPDFSVHQLLHEIGVPEQSRSFYQARLMGNVSSSLSRFVGHRPSGAVTPVTELSVLINEQLLHDVLPARVISAIADKYDRRDYEALDDGEAQQIVRAMWQRHERDEEAGLVQHPHPSAEEYLSTIQDIMASDEYREWMEEENEPEETEDVQMEDVE